jgi:hypothetical protein
MLLAPSRRGQLRSAGRARPVTEPCKRVKPPRNALGERRGPARHLRLLQTGSARLSFINCRTLGADEAVVDTKLASYTRQLGCLGSGVAGLAEVRVPGSGKRKLNPV